jgi:hypothetical protein
MSLHVEIVCDGCREPFENTFSLDQTPAQVRTYVAARGWRLGVPWRSQAVDLCGRCVDAGRDALVRANSGRRA